VASGASAITDSAGYYRLAAAAGDTLWFRHTGYTAAYEIMTYSLQTRYKTILLRRHQNVLQEATVKGLTKYQQDSLARREVYDHELTRPLLVDAPKISPGGGGGTIGIGCSGCVGWLADKITGNSKRPKRFRKNFAADDETRFIDSRYNYDLVTSLTGIKDIDSVAAFIYAYPLDYPFARAATDLELKSWVLQNYRAWRSRKS
jgi:hypothetical protein